MKEQDIKILIQEMINQNNSLNQFNLSNIPFHVHNGLDSPYVALGDVTIENNPRISPIYGIIAGRITKPFTASSVTITDQRITTSSVIVATSSSNVGEALQAVCNNGSATISYIINTTMTANYIIII